MAYSAAALKQQRFAAALGLLMTEGLRRVREVYPDAHFRLGEGFVGDSIKPWMKTTHRRDGGHYKRLAIDLVLDIAGSYVRTSDHPAWLILHSYWEELDQDAASSIPNDANHFSFLDNGVA